MNDFGWKTWCDPRYITTKKFRLQGDGSFSNWHMLHLMDKLGAIVGDCEETK